MNNRKISVVIPYYNRSDMVMETLQYPLADDRINEIIICDDFSPRDDIRNLLKNIDGLPKIKFIKNVANFHNQHNKRNCISFAQNEWSIILDNDNCISKDFVDKLFSIPEWDVRYIYHPAFAAPNFDYRYLNGKTIDKYNIASLCQKDIFMTLLNTNNYFVNRDMYIKVYNYDKTVRGADGIYFAYNWVSKGNYIHIVTDMEYFHRVHSGSEFLRESDSNMKLINYWFDKVKQLK
jgi:hypothetical protein